MSRQTYQIVFLDAGTVDRGDLSMDTLKRVGRYRAIANCPRGKVARLVKNAEVVITNKVVLGEAEMKQLPGLKLICVAATGTNNIDLVTAKRCGIAVCNVAGYSTNTVVEHTLMFLLALSHRLLQHHASVMNGSWSRYSHFAYLEFPFSDLKGKTLGIIGYGHIGQGVAKLARDLGMKVLIGKIPGRKYSRASGRSELRTLLKKSDFVSLHCALSPQTLQLIDRKRLSWMKPKAYLLNLARGPVVVEEDIAWALRHGKLAGYASDVFSQEPPPQGHPLFHPLLRDKVLFTPHIAWASRESRQHMVEEMAKNIEAFWKGQRRNRLV
jgi:glycerate dehydrogenase